MNAKASYKGKEGKGPRYAVYDFQYELEAGEGTRFVCEQKGRNGFGKGLADQGGWWIGTK